MYQIRLLDTCESIGGPEWTVLGNDTTNLRLSTVCASGSRAIQFDKADGTVDTVHAGV